MAQRPRIQATSISISTSDPRELAQFYARLLGVEVTVSEGPREGDPATAGWAQLRPTEGALVMTLNFEWDEHYVPPAWPTPPPTALTDPGPTPVRHVGEQQVMAHLDLWVDDLEEAEAWALQCGASRHEHQPQERVRVMLDPHGHPFCLFVG